jgi:hypothetical protein
MCIYVYMYIEGKPGDEFFVFHFLSYGECNYIICYSKGSYRVGM